MWTTKTTRTIKKGNLKSDAMDLLFKSMDGVFSNLVRTNVSCSSN